MSQLYHFGFLERPVDIHFGINSARAHLPKYKFKPQPKHKPKPQIGNYGILWGFASSDITSQSGSFLFSGCNVPPPALTGPDHVSPGSPTVDALASLAVFNLSAIEKQLGTSQISFSIQFNNTGAHLNHLGFILVTCRDLADVENITNDIGFTVVDKAGSTGVFFSGPSNPGAIAGFAQGVPSSFDKPLKGTIGVKSLAVSLG